MSDTTESTEPTDTNAEAASSTTGNVVPSSLEGPTSDDFKYSHPDNINADVLQNISVSMAIEVGRAQIKIKDLMRLTQGSVVELDRIAGEPLDLLINNTVVAQGEVVLVNDRYGIRLTRVVPSTDRLKTI